ncbi:MAG: lytic transglycosylase domain-containing protein [Blastocatellia bacterium]
MKFLAILMLICASGVLNATARAQEARLAADADTAGVAQPETRTPSLVLIKEAVKPTLDTKAAATKAPVTAPATAKPTPAMVVTQPIVMPSGATTGQAGAVEQIIETTGNPKYDEYIKQSAAHNGIDPNLLVAVMRHESGFNSRAVSYKGATGLMQLMPGTARRFGVTNIYDPQQNIEGGARYLRFLLDQFNGDINLVLAGYNAGENAVVNSGYRVPRYRETQAYVKNISARYDRVKGRSQRAKAATAGPVAPAVETFAGGRLSNNY